MNDAEGKKYTAPTALDCLPVACAKGYFVTSDGRCWTTKRQGCTSDGWPMKRLKSTPTAKGYHQVSFRVGEGKVTRQVHSLVYETFAGPIPEGMTVDHIHGNKDDNRLGELRLLSQPDNVRAYVERVGGRPGQRGAAHNRSAHKVTEEQVREARRLYREGVPQNDLCRAFGITAGPMSMLVNGKSFGWVTE